MPAPYHKKAPWYQQNWPIAADPRQAALFIHDLENLWQEEGKDLSILNQHDISLMLHAVGGNSLYLSDLIRKNISFFEILIEKGPDKACSHAFNTLKHFSIQESRQSVAKQIRITKQEIALCCALTDIGNVWTLEQITKTLSFLAEQALELSVNYLLRNAHDTGKINLQYPNTPSLKSGLIILGMGKLGARELNYSSDIDLIILYDPDCYPNHDELHTFFVRLTRQLVSLMEDRDENGYVFRTDLRLRPDPASSPLAVSLPAAISYYESLGQTWERAAMSKARPVAGDIAAGNSFLETIRPFIWRRHLDFAIIDDIHAMKNHIDKYKKTGKKNLTTLPADLSDKEALYWLLGQNLKLGQGGIREIEFCPQTMQLVWGGRNPDLRDSTTIGGINKLVKKNLLPASKAEKLVSAYYLLRKTEHRLQMLLDQQTHSLPDNIQELRNFTIFMGYSRPEDFSHELFPLMRSVRLIFESLFTAPSNDETYILDLPPDELKHYLEKKGFPEEAVEILQSWNHGRLRALRTTRARNILINVLPNLLDAFAAQQDPLTLLRRFDTLLERHQAGIQLLSLFERNPALLNRIASIIGASPFLAEHIANTPAAIDALLEQDNWLSNQQNFNQIIHYHLKNSTSLEDAMPYLHNLVHGEEFRLSVAFLENRISLDKSQIMRTKLADSIMKLLLDKVLTEHKAKHGTIPHGGMCIVVLGKAGSQEMTSGSDLDLMLIFDHPADIIESSLPKSRSIKNNLVRPRSLSSSQYYLRLAHNFISVLTAPGRTGALYEVDMRLRPSGSKGPVAVSLSSFQRYHKEEAWTWERMALTRARIIGGPLALQRKIQAAINDALYSTPHNRTANDLLQDACDMRSRLLRDAPASSPWDIKHRDGGLIEVEFIAQIYQLIARKPEARHPCTRIALRRLAKQGFINKSDAKSLIQADYFWRNLQSVLRIFFGKNPPHDLSKALTPCLMEFLGQDILHKSLSTYSDFKDIEKQVERTSAIVRKLFIKLVGDPLK